RPYYEMPGITARICGICPISHLLASSKACDAIMAVRIPPTARQLRELIHCAQMVQSHALSFFYLSSPDFLLGMDSDIATRNVLGVIAAHPELARDGILADLPAAKAIAERTIAFFKGALDSYKEEIEYFGSAPTMYAGLVDVPGNLQFYDGGLRFLKADGEIAADHVPAEDYAGWIGEASLRESYLKAPYFKPQGFPDGVYRVGPLARLNVAQQCGFPKADAEFQEFHQRFGAPAHSAFLNHYARLIEIICALEKIEILLNSPKILD